MSGSDVRRVGDYRLIQQIGRGGMAEIWEAESQARPGVRVALKRVSWRDGDDTSAGRKLLEEAQMVRTLVHPNIVRILDVGEVCEPFFTMELLVGRNLARLASSRALPLGLTVGLGLQILEGLAYAHTRMDEHRKPLEVVHRDIKPSNLFVTVQGVAKVIDFGIAKGSHFDQTSTETGMLKGSLPYTSPEVVRNERSTPQSDLFSLGLVLHELVTRKRVFAQPSDAAIVSAILWSPALPIRVNSPDAPEALERLLLWALEKDPARRPASARAFAEALKKVLPPEEIWPAARVGEFVQQQMQTSSTSTLDRRDISTAEPEDAALARSAPVRHRRNAPWALGALGVMLAASLWTWHTGATLPSKATFASAVPLSPGVPIPLPPTPPSPSSGPPEAEGVARLTPLPHPPAARAPVHAASSRALAPGWLTVGSRKGWARIFLDGKELGPTPIFHRALAPGHHRMESIRPDGSRASTSVVISSAQELRAVAP